MLRGAGLVDSQEDGMAKDKETVDVLVVGAVGQAYREVLVVA